LAAGAGLRVVLALDEFDRIDDAVRDSRESGWR